MRREDSDQPFEKLPRIVGHRGRRKKIGHQERPTVRHGYFHSFDGTRLFYSEEGAGLPLIFCYGLVCSSLHWTYQIDHFRSHYRTLWFDYRGHQSSDRPRDLDTVTIESSARDLACLMDALNIPKAIILGHSMGVNVVLDFVRQFPDRAHGIVLANGTPSRPLDLLLGGNLLVPAFTAMAHAQRWFPKLTQEAWKLSANNPLIHTLIAMGGFNPHLTPREDVVRYVQQVATIPPEIFLQLIKSYQKYDATPWLHTLDVPALVIGGNLDKVTPWSQQRILANLMPQARLELIRHGSHCPQMDLPDLFNRLVSDFFLSLNYPPAETSPSSETASRSSSPASPW